MNELFGTNAVIEETAATARYRGLFKSTLMFLLIYFVGSIINGLLASIPTYFYLFNTEEMTQFAEAGIMDPDLLEATIESAMANAPTWFNAITLFGTAGVIIATIYYCVKFEGRRIFTLGFTKNGALKEYATGLGIGLVMFGAAYGIILLSGQAKFGGFNTECSWSAILILFLGFVVQGMSEEVLLRGYYFVTAGSDGKIALAIFASSAFFAFAHLGNDGISLMAMLNLFLFGIFAALYFLRRGNIWGIGAIHSIWNFAQGNIFGCKVSGINAGDSIMSTEYIDGNAIFNGGAFGPEGGLGVTIVLFIGIVVLLFMKNKEVEPPVFKNEFFGA